MGEEREEEAMLVNGFGRYVFSMKLLNINTRLH